MKPSTPDSVQDRRALRRAIADTLRVELGDSYDCTRTWGAWAYGTMTEDDFDPVEDRVDDIVDSVMRAIDEPPVVVEIRRARFAGDLTSAICAAAIATTFFLIWISR